MIGNYQEQNRRKNHFINVASTIKVNTYEKLLDTENHNNEQINVHAKTGGIHFFTRLRILNHNSTNYTETTETFRLCFIYTAKQIIGQCKLHNKKYDNSNSV